MWQKSKAGETMLHPGKTSWQRVFVPHVHKSLEKLWEVRTRPSISSTKARRSLARSSGWLWRLQRQGWGWMMDEWIMAAGLKKVQPSSNPYNILNHFGAIIFFRCVYLNVQRCSEFHQHVAPSPSCHPKLWEYNRKQNCQEQEHTATTDRLWGSRFFTAGVLWDISNDILTVFFLPLHEYVSPLESTGTEWIQAA